MELIKKIKRKKTFQNCQNVNKSQLNFFSVLLKNNLINFHILKSNKIVLLHQLMLGQLLKLINLKLHYKHLYFNRIVLNKNPAM